MIHDSDTDTEHAHGLQLGTRGWRHAHWQNTFYPDDLPEDWQLAYYANEFSTVLVPVEAWSQQADVAQWLDDVPEGFRFYMEAPQQQELYPLFTMTCEMLQDKLEGVVANEVIQLPITAPVYVTQETDAQNILFREQTNGSMLALLEEDYADLKVLRKWLQQVMAENELHGIFLSNKSVSVQQLRDVKTLVELLGF